MVMWHYLDVSSIPFLESDNLFTIIKDYSQLLVFLVLSKKLRDYLLRIYQKLIIWQNLNFHIAIYLENPNISSYYLLLIYN